MFGQDGWILAKFFFCVFMDRDGVKNDLSLVNNDSVTRMSDLVVHAAGPHPGFGRIKQLGVFLLPPG